MVRDEEEGGGDDDGERGGGEVSSRTEASGGGRKNGASNTSNAEPMSDLRRRRIAETMNSENLERDHSSSSVMRSLFMGWFNSS